MTTRRTFLRAGAMASLGIGLPAARAASGYQLPPSVLGIPWTDSDGRTVRLADFDSQPTVMTMSYAGCRRTCSTTMLVLADLQRLLDAHGQDWRFLIVSFDPENDTPGVWSDYRRIRGLSRPNWHFLTGSERDTRRIARYLDLDFWRYHGHPMHDFRIVMYEPGFRFLQTIEWGDTPRLPATMARLQR